ncbi:MAG: hypothetical protein WC627_11685 [Legionella sp.]|jgi:hypothetical protein
MRKITYGLGTAGIIAIICLATNVIYANYPSHHVPAPEKDAVMEQFQPYVAIAGGYGNFESMAQNTGNTAFGRLAIGITSPIDLNTALGAEVGIQSAKRMRLTDESVAPFFARAYFPLPVFVTISPPIDILATLNYHMSPQVFFELKAGGVYLQSMIDDADIAGINQWNAEVQAGLGFNISDSSRIVFGYQHFFGNTPGIKHLSLRRGTAQLSNLPSWNAGMITYEKSF